MLFFLALLTIQLSFIQALPFPFDRTPLFLLVTIYLYQYVNQTQVWWWPICYGFILDVYTLSPAPLETISYSLLALCIGLLAKHVFTNRSFYGVSGTITTSLLILTVSQSLINIIFGILRKQAMPWQVIVGINQWAVLLGCGGFFVLFPFAKRARFFLQQLFFLRT